MSGNVAPNNDHSGVIESVLENITKVYQAVVANTLRPEHGHILYKYLEEKIFHRISEETGKGLVPRLSGVDLSHASRLLLLLAASAHETEDPGSVEQLYTDLLMGTTRGLHEFFTLGTALATFGELVATHGEKCLAGSYFELPFVGQEVPGLQPVRSPVRLESSQRLHSLQRMWCNVYVTLCSGNSQASTGKATWVGIVVPSVLSEFRPLLGLSTIAAFAKRARSCKLPLEGISAVSHAIVSLCKDTALPVFVRQEAFADMLRLLEAIAQSASRAPHGGNDDKDTSSSTHGSNGGMNSNRMQDNEFLRVEVAPLREALRAMHAALEALIGREHILRVQSTSTQQLAVTLSRVLQTYAAKFRSLSQSASLASATPPAMMVVATFCMRALGPCVISHARSMPSLPTLIACCVEQSTQHACISLVNTILQCNSEMSLLLLKGLDALSHEPSLQRVAMLARSTPEDVPNPSRPNIGSNGVDQVDSNHRHARFAAEAEAASSGVHTVREISPLRGAEHPNRISPLTPSSVGCKSTPAGSYGFEFRHAPNLVLELIDYAKAIQADNLADADGRSGAPAIGPATVTLLLYEAYLSARKCASRQSFSDSSARKAGMGAVYLLETAYHKTCQRALMFARGVLKLGASSARRSNEGSIQLRNRLSGLQRAGNDERNMLWMPLLSVSRIIALWAMEPHLLVSTEGPSSPQFLQLVSELADSGLTLLTSEDVTRDVTLEERLYACGPAPLAALSHSDILQWMENKNFASLLLYAITFPSRITSEASVTSGSPLFLPTVWKHVSALNPSLQAQLLLRAVTHGRNSLHALLSRESPLTPHSPEHSAAIQRILQHCLRICSMCLEVRPDALKASVFETVALTCAAATTALYRAYPSERRALTSCSSRSCALRRVLDPAHDITMSLADPEGKFALVLLFKLDQLWSHSQHSTDDASSSRGGGRSGSANANKSHADGSLASVLATSLTPYVCKVWKLLVPHIERVLAAYDGHSGSRQVASFADEHAGYDGVLPAGPNVSAAASELARSRVDGIASLEALTHLRTLVGAISASLAESHSSTARNAQASIVTVADAIDSTCDELLRRTHAVSHAIATRLAQLAAVCMLGNSFQAGLMPLSDLDVEDCRWGQHHTAPGGSRRATKRTPEDPGPVGVLGRHLFTPQFSAASHGQSREHSRGASMFLETDLLMQDSPAGTQDVGRSTSHPPQVVGASLISLMAHARFLGHSILTNPHAAVWALSQISYVWAHCTHAHAPAAQVAYDELSRLCRLQLMQYLLMANVDNVVMCVVLPLLLFTPKPGEEHCRAWVLRALCSKPLADMAPVGAEGYDSLFARFAHAHILVGLSFSPAPPRGGTRSLLLEDPITFHSVCDVTDLLDNYPKVLYQLLLSKTLQQVEDVTKVLEGSFEALLQHCATTLGVPIFGAYYRDDNNGPSKMDKMGPFYRTSVQRAILPAVWDLGSADFARKECALKALRMFCTIIQAKELSQRPSTTRGGRDAASGSNLSGDESIATTLPDLFLYIMANVLEDNKSIEPFTLLQSVQSVRCLKELVVLLRQEDLVRFLPKVMSTMDGVLGDASPQLRYVGVELTAELVKRLPHTVLCTHLSALVVGLYPSLDERFPGAAPRGNFAAHCEDALHELSVRGNLPPVRQAQHYVREPSLHMPDNRLGLSPDMMCICEAAHASQVARQWDIKARTAAVDIINDLFLKRRSDIKSAMQSVAHIPNIPELSNVHALHAKETRALTLEQTIHLLCGMLRNDSSMVRRMGLSRLLEVLRDSPSKLQLYSSLSSPTSASASHGQDNTVSHLLLELLLLVCKEHAPEVLDACARCLGEIGAIDPARVTVALSAAMRSRSSAVSVPATAGSPRSSAGDSPRGDSTSVVQVGNPPPWECALVDMGLLLLEHHFVPELRTGTEQDFTCYGIQSILTELVGNADHKGEIPDDIRVQLLRRNILDVVEPFWTTKYRIQTHTVSLKTPVYRPAMNFSLWISRWVRHLMQLCSGSTFSSLFEACRGVLKARDELSQFVLPHVVVSYLQQHGSRVGEGSDNAVLWEICYVLSGASETKDKSTVAALVPSLDALSKANSGMLFSAVGSAAHQPVQAVFSLLDTLSSWAVLGLQKQKSASSSSSRDPSNAVAQKQAQEAQETGILLNKFVDDVPTELLCFAALQVRAYTRALRYFEQHIRATARMRKRQNESIAADSGIRKSKQRSESVGSAELIRVQRSDGSNGELPTLEKSQLDLLLMVYSKLGDPDALQGVQMLHRSGGYASTPWTRVLELEQTDDWLGALLEYGLLQDGCGNNAEQSDSNKKRRLMESPAPSVASHLRSSSHDTTPTTSSRKRKSPSKGNSAAADAEVHNLDEGDDEDTIVDMDEADGDSVAADLQSLCAIEMGRLRCLIELGQLDSVVDQTLGMVQRLPELEPMLLPMGVEATWRLQQWGNLSAFLTRADALENSNDMVDAMEVSGRVSKEDGFNRSAAISKIVTLGGTRSQVEDSFSLSVGRLMLSLHTCDRAAFNEQMQETRRRTMSSLAAASMESYGRAYPLLVRLHILTEIETGYELVHLQDGNVLDTDKGKELKRSQLLGGWHWDERLNLMSASARQRSTALAVRRTLLSAAGLRKDVARNWLGLSETMRHLGHFDAARVALRSAEQQGVSEGEALLHECRILKDSGHTHAALMLIEPIEPDTAAIRQVYKECRRSGGAALPEFLSSQDRVDNFVEKLFLATQLMVHSKTNQGITIIDRYKCIIDLRSRSPNAYFELARYYEYLYHAAKSKEAADNAGASMPVSSNASVASSRSFGARSNDDYDFKSHNWVILAIQAYLKAVYYCQPAEASHQSIVVQALPRMLTLFMSFTALRDADLGAAAQRLCTLVGFAGKVPHTSSGTPYRGIDSLRKAQTLCCESVRSFASKIPPAIWFSCMPQLVSRTGHGHRETLDVVTHIILKVLVAHPKQSVWHVAGLLQSLIPSRQALGDDLVKRACASLGSHNAEDSAMLGDAKAFFRNLIDLAEAQHKERRMQWKWPKGVDYRRFVVPMQGVLAAIPRPAGFSEPPVSSSLSTVAQTEMYIQRFSETVDVASSKAKPKTVYLTTVCGKTIKFLCKQEKNGDLRKDARMMEFNTAVNRLFQADAEGRRRNLRLRTYAVVCLNEECGILEWVDNTAHLRHLIAEAHTYHPRDYPTVNTKEIFHPFTEAQVAQADNLAELVKQYHLLILDNYSPCFHRWFLGAFPDPTAWFDARTAFTRSAAVWSAVGHVVGLGDRHTENVLIDTTCGECVHVDFDCVFDKGLTLARPEIVPFRLTPNLVDAMGVTGVEGTYRRTMEACFTLLRDNKETLMAVLEPFLRDPTVAWGRGGRAQRAEHIATGSTNRGATTHLPEHTENADAKEALEKISGRLIGVYNLINPSKYKILKGYSKRKEIAPRFGLGAAEDEALPLSVEGQVQRLIDEARAEENLAQMYIGWQPWA